MAEIRAEVSQLSEVMAQPMGRTFFQVVALLPGQGSEIDFELEVFFQVIDSDGG